MANATTTAAVDFDAVIREEAKQQAEYERTKIVTREGETIADLRKVFDAVCDQKQWKNEWAAAVPHQIVGVVCRASEFFQGSKVEIVGIQQITGKVLLRSPGYCC